MQTNKNTSKYNHLTLFTLVLLITGAIDSIRNLPATALFGSSLIFFFILAAIIFLIPIAMISAQFAACHPEKGGVYHWVKMAFGAKLAFIAIWLQWINTMIWYPTILSFIAGTAAFIIDPTLAQNKTYLVSTILIVFWFMTLINLRGLQISARFTSFCALIGMVIPMLIIIGMAIYWVISGHPIQVSFHLHDILPSMNNKGGWISLTAIMASFLGIELAAVHVKQIDNPQKNFPKALFISVTIILITMIFGSLSIAIALPKEDINLVEGVMQAFHNFFEDYHVLCLMPIITVMILLGSLGGMINWIISPAKGLLQAAQDGFLPDFLGKENKYGVPQNMLLLQAVLVSLVCLSFLLMPSVNGSYWLLTDLSTQLYMMMYIFVFMAAISIRKELFAPGISNVIPGGIKGLWLFAILGLLGCCLTLVIGFFPPDEINVGNVLHFEVIFVSGIILAFVPAIIIARKAINEDY